MYLAICVAGLFIFDEESKLIKFKLFKKDSEYIAERIDKFQKKETFSELEELKREFKDLREDEKTDNYLKENFREIVKKTGFVKSEEELNRIIAEVSIALTKRKIMKLEKRDKLIVHAVSSLTDLDKILNLMTERLREWYGMHYPELNISDPKKFTEFVIKHGRRDKDSIGMELKEEDVKALQEFSKEIKNLYDLRENTENYLEKTVKEEMPNTSALLGSILAARILALAGSLEKLAKLPSSTLQLLGSEKSLFKFLKGEQKKVPKFGLICTHPDIMTAKKEKQGKIARLLSSKLTLAVRADFYSKRNMSKELLEDYKRKLKEVK